MQAQQQAIVPTVDVLAVTRAIPFGEEITPEDVTTIKYAKEFLPEGVFLTKDALFPDGEDVLRSVILPIGPNEALTAANVQECVLSQLRLTFLLVSQASCAPATRLTSIGQVLSAVRLKCAATTRPT